MKNKLFIDIEGFPFMKINNEIKEFISAYKQKKSIIWDDNVIFYRKSLFDAQTEDLLPILLVYNTNNDIIGIKLINGVPYYDTIFINKLKKHKSLFLCGITEHFNILNI
jgi:hypothetical protein